jgi:hypothetical protein
MTDCKCLICNKKIEDGYCENCHESTFHNAHITLLKNYLTYDDPLKEIKRILAGEY